MITWCPLKFPECHSNLDILAQEVESVPSRYWFHCHYRNCDILALVSEGGSCRRDFMGDKKSIAWTEAAEWTPQLKNYLDESILPLFSPMPRVMALRTGPSESIPVHFDCSEHELDQINYKVRMVLSGDTDTLYFMSKNRQKVYIPSGHPFYLLDGCHPHGNDNRELGKVTLAFGSPWRTFSGTKLEALVEESIKNNSESVIHRDQIGRDFEKKWFDRPKVPYTMLDDKL